MVGTAKKRVEEAGRRSGKKRREGGGGGLIREAGSLSLSLTTGVISGFPPPPLLLVLTYFNGTGSNYGKTDMCIFNCSHIQKCFLLTAATARQAINGQSEQRGMIPTFQLHASTVMAEPRHGPTD